MCMMLYLASDHPLALVERREKGQDFCVSALNDHERGVLKQFSKPYVYAVDAYGGCGCGFNYGEWGDLEEAGQVAAARRSVARLSQYLADALEPSGELEIFTPWDGERGQEPLMRRVLRPSQIGGEAFWFQGRQFTTVVPDTA